MLPSFYGCVNCFLDDAESCFFVFPAEGFDGFPFQLFVDMKEMFDFTEKVSPYLGNISNFLQKAEVMPDINNTCVYWIKT